LVSGLAGNDGATYSSPGACAGGAVAYSKGQMTGHGNAKSSTAYKQFDVLGRVRRVEQTTGLVPVKSIQYGYNLGDFLTSMTLPSGRQISYTPNGAIE
jgi:hypothetical protein